MAYEIGKYGVYYIRERLRVPSLQDVTDIADITHARKVRLAHAYEETIRQDVRFSNSRFKTWLDKVSECKVKSEKSAIEQKFGIDLPEFEKKIFENLEPQNIHIDGIFDDSIIMLTERDILTKCWTSTAPEIDNMPIIPLFWLNSTGAFVCWNYDSSQWVLLVLPENNTVSISIEVNNFHKMLRVADQMAAMMNVSNGHPVFNDYIGNGIDCFLEAVTF